MQAKPRYLTCVVILSLLCVAGAWAQAPSIPPDVQAIIDKAKSGHALSKTDTTRLQQWGQSMQAAASSGGAGRASAASSSAVPAMGAQGPTPPCPAARGSLVTAVAPTRAEYVVPVKSLADTYGRKLGTRRAEFDRIFAEPGSSPAQSAAALYIGGAAGASV
jgi:hypothetical protein